MKKPFSGLLAKFAIIFLVFSLLTLCLSGVAAFFSQMQIYENQCKSNVQQVARYLKSLIVSEGEDFITYQNYFSEHFQDMNVPFDFDGYQDAMLAFDTLFQKEYPGMVLGEDIELEDCSKEVQEAYFVYTQEYWIHTFENAEKEFDILYAYYFYYADEVDYNIVTVIDFEREAKDENGELLEELYPPEGHESEYNICLGITVPNPPEKYPIEWRTWDTGMEQNEFQIWDNEFGHNYAYYVPVFINGQRMGVVAVEVGVDSVNQEILSNTIAQMLRIGLVQLFCMFLMLIFINRKYIRKIETLRSDVQKYTQEKDPVIAGEI